MSTPPSDSATRGEDATQPTSSLYARLGGEGAVTLAVERFYDRVLADPRLQPFFAQADTGRLRAHQKAFLMFALGGAPGYGGQGLRAAHAGLVSRLGLTDVHFDAVLEHLSGSLASLGAAPALIAEVAGLVEGTRKDVLGR